MPTTATTPLPQEEDSTKRSIAQSIKVHQPLSQIDLLNQPSNQIDAFLAGPQGILSPAPSVNPGDIPVPPQMPMPTTATTQLPVVLRNGYQNPNRVIYSLAVNTTSIPTPTLICVGGNKFQLCLCSEYSPGQVSLTTTFYHVPSILCICEHGLETHLVTFSQNDEASLLDEGYCSLTQNFPFILRSGV